MSKLHKFMTRVDKLMDERHGLDSYDLEAPYEEYFEDGLTAKQVARTVLEDHGFPYEEDPCIGDGFALMALEEDDQPYEWERDGWEG